MNDVALHGIPTPERLEDGDLLSVDAGATLDGWVGDAAITFSVGTVREADARLVATAEAALQAGIAAAVVGDRVGDISAAISAVGRAGGCGINTDQGGHGVGRTMHEAPHVPNEGRAGRGVPLRAGLVIAIEPWFLAGGNDDYRVDADGWTLRSADGSRAAHVEHTVAVTDDGPRHPHRAALSAWSRSASRSSTSSMPTDSRTRSVGHLQRRAGRTDVWVISPRVLDQRLDAAERLGEREQLRRRSQTSQRRLLAAGQPERHHPAEAAHLLGRDVVAGVLGQARVEHRRDRRVAGEHLGDARGVVASAGPCARRAS